MKKIFSLLIVIISFSCRTNNEAEKDQFLLDIVEADLRNVKDDIRVLSTNNVDSNDYETMINTNNIYYNLLKKSNQNNIQDTWRDSLKIMILKLQSAFSIDAKSIIRHIDTIKTDIDFKLQLTINELSLLNKIYKILVSNRLMFSTYRVLQVQGQDGFTKLYFTALLDSVNSEIGFASFDSITHEMKPDTLNKNIIKNIDGYYAVKLSDKKKSSGFLKFRRQSGAFDYYPFK